MQGQSYYNQSYYDNEPLLCAESLAENRAAIRLPENEFYEPLQSDDRPRYPSELLAPEQPGISNAIRSGRFEGEQYTYSQSSWGEKQYQQYVQEGNYAEFLPEQREFGVESVQNRQYESLGSSTIKHGTQGDGRNFLSPEMQKVHKVVAKIEAEHNNKEENSMDLGKVAEALSYINNLASRCETYRPPTPSNIPHNMKIDFNSKHAPVLVFNCRGSCRRVSPILGAYLKLEEFILKNRNGRVILVFDMRNVTHVCYDGLSDISCALTLRLPHGKTYKDYLKCICFIRSKVESVNLEMESAKLAMGEIIKERDRVPVVLVDHARDVDKAILKFK